MSLQRRLEPREASQFSHEGFFLTRGLCQITPEVDFELKSVVDRASAIRTTEFVNGAKYVLNSKGNCCRVEWVPYEAPSIRGLMSHPALLNVVKQIVCWGQLDLIICQFNFRRGDDGVVYDWHRDTQQDKGEFANPANLDRAVLVSIAVTDIGPSVAPLSVIPKSHLNVNSDILEPCDNFKAVTLPMKRGDVLFMHPALLHKSDKNLTNLFRGLLIGLFVPSDSYYRVNSNFSMINLAI